VRFHQLSLLVGLLFAVQAAPVFGQSPTRPNILMIVVDDLNDYQHYLMDGHPQAETPNLDRLARNGVIFQNTHCTAPKSSPSRTSFMSGKTAVYTGVLNNDSVRFVFRDNFRDLAKDTVVYTIPEVLRDSGYYTVGINKMYFGWKNPFFDNDFDTLNPDPCTRGLSWSENIVFAPDQSLIDYRDWGIKGYIWSQVPDSIEPLMFDRAAADTAVGILTDYANNPAAYCNKPLFLGLGIFLPHKPLIIPERHWLEDYLRPEEFYETPFDPSYNEPAGTWPPNGVFMPPQPDPIHADFYALGVLGQDLALGGNQALGFDRWPDDSLSPKPVIDTALTEDERNFILSESQRANAVAGYLAGVRFADYQIGRVLDALDSLGIAENTIVIFTSDHGYSLGEKRHWHKFAPWETDLRVPLVIKDNRRGYGGSVLAPASTLDLFPTILDMVGIGEPKNPDGSRYLDGISLEPYLTNPNLNINRPVMGALRRTRGRSSCFTTFSVRSDEYHYIRHQGLPDGGFSPCDTASTFIEEELYHIGRYRDVDPNEHRNLAFDPRYRGVMDFLSQWVADSAYYNTTPPTIVINTDELACGYVYTDTLRLTVELFGPNGGAATTLQASVDFRFRFALIDRDTSFVNVTNLDLPLEQLLSGLEFASGERIVVYAEVYEVASGQVVALDALPLNLNPSFWPDNYFDADVASNMVRIENLMYQNEDQIKRVVWRFDDGAISTLPNPGSHKYEMPGTYTIDNLIFYGNDTSNLCSRSFSQTVTIDPLGFNNGECMPPNGINMVNIGLDRARFEWNPVYGALGYQTRIRARTGQDTAWRYRVVSGTDGFEKDLLPDRDYELQVRVLCDVSLGLSSLSAWSYPTWFTTMQCNPPRGIESSNITANEAQINWLKNPNATFGYAMEVEELAGSASALINLLPTNQRILSSLDSATAYRYRLRSRCPNLGGGETPGPFSQWYTFATEGGMVRLPDQDAALSVFPNPAREAFTVQWYGWNRGPLTLRLHDNLGRELLRMDLDGDGAGRHTLNRANWPAGVYRVVLEQEGLPKVQSLILTD
jgi:arylsulfatase A-like enzyme